MQALKMAASAVLAALLVACGSGNVEVGSSRSAASVAPISYPSGTVVECADFELPAGTVQVPIGIFGSATTPPWDLTYPVDLAGLGQGTLTFSSGNTVVAFSVTGDVRVVAAIVRAFDTGTNAYVYGSPGVTSDTGLSGPAGSGDRRISRVKLCVIPFEETGCTLTYGYWKTHSEKGPAAHPDATWDLIGASAEDTLFFNSGKTYYEVLQTPPKGGNAFFILAHQTIAARLNVLAGATAPAELAQAEALFASLGAGVTTIPLPKVTLALSLASALDDYNNGVTGPGHCAE